MSVCATVYLFLQSQRTYTDPFSLTFQYSFEKVQVHWIDEIEIKVWCYTIVILKAE